MCNSRKFLQITTWRHFHRGEALIFNSNTMAIYSMILAIHELVIWRRQLRSVGISALGKRRYVNGSQPNETHFKRKLQIRYTLPLFPGFLLLRGDERGSMRSANWPLFVINWGCYSTSVRGVRDTRIVHLTYVKQISPLSASDFRPDRLVPPSSPSPPSACLRTDRRFHFAIHIILYHCSCIVHNCWQGYDGMGITHLSNEYSKTRRRWHEWVPVYHRVPVESGLCSAYLCSTYSQTHYAAILLPWQRHARGLSPRQHRGAWSYSILGPSKTA